MSTVLASRFTHASAPLGGIAVSPAGLPSGAGVDLIASQSFAAASAVSVNGCFTSAYDNYRIVTTFTTTALADILGRVRSSGVDVSSATYEWTNMDNNTFTNSTAQTMFIVGIGEIGLLAASTVEMFGPALASRTNGTLHTRRSASGTRLGSFTHTAATSYDGFSFYPSSGTFTGVVRVYGYGD